MLGIKKHRGWIRIAAEGILKQAIERQEHDDKARLEKIERVEGEIWKLQKELRKLKDAVT